MLVCSLKINLFNFIKEKTFVTFVVLKSAKSAKSAREILSPNFKKYNEHSGKLFIKKSQYVRS